MYRILFFFFQAEDGIRDIGVTGVQTCALPISLGHGHLFISGPGTRWASASPPTTEPACADTESRGTCVTDAMEETNRGNGPSWAELDLYSRIDMCPGASSTTRPESVTDRQHIDAPSRYGHRSRA